MLCSEIILWMWLILMINWLYAEEITLDNLGGPNPRNWKDVTNRTETELMGPPGRKRNPACGLQGQFLARGSCLPFLISCHILQTCLVSFPHLYCMWRYPTHSISWVDPWLTKYFASFSTSHCCPALAIFCALYFDSPCLPP